MSCRARSKGQVLVISLGLLLACCAGLYFMFNTGQVAIAKQRLTNAADAAAWSAALWRARVLNYHAYSNRAIVANEVAIAQAVTLVSWAEYFESLTRNAATVGSYFPPARAVLEGVAEAAMLASEAARIAATIEVPARGASLIGYKEILQTSQEILHLSTHGFGLNTVAAEVARANDPGYFAFLLPDLGSYLRMTRRYTSDEDRQRLAGLVVDSLDPFTRGPRAENIRTPIPSTCLAFMRIRKRGGTELLPTLDRWEAVDTMSFHQRSLSRFRCRESELLPLAWGAAEAGELPGTDSVSANAGETAINPRASGWADMQSFGNYGGISRIRELDYDALDGARFPTSTIAVVARQKGGDVRTAQNRKLASGRMLQSDRFVGSSPPYLWAMSAAEVYFRRPPDAPPRVEYASLFSPYWQVRLVEPTLVQRAAALVYAR
jgi:hypothetical protein